MKKAFVPHIDDSEEVARIVTAPSMLDEGEVSPSAFALEDKLPRSGEKEIYLSVNRTRFGYPDKNKIRWKPRAKGDKHFGYALLIVREILGLSDEDFTLRVWPYPSSANIGHAGIHYYERGTQIIGACESLGFLEIRLALASISRLIPFPA